MSGTPQFVSQPSSANNFDASPKQDIDDYARTHGLDAARRAFDTDASKPAAPPHNNGAGATKPADQPKRSTRTAELPCVNIADWDQIEPSPQPWAVEHRIPQRQVTLFSGHGASGKSIVSLQLVVAHVLGADWLGSMPKPGPALYLGAEDEADDLHRRVAPILAFYNQARGGDPKTFADLERAGLALASFAGKDMVLARSDQKSGHLQPSPLFVKVTEKAEALKPVCVVIDTSADAFGGHEIDRGDVRQFIALLRKLAIGANASVVLIAHPSLTGLNSGTGLSGSTAWHNSVRARMYLRTLDESDERDVARLANGSRILEFHKNQFGPLAASITLEWRNGLFQPRGKGGDFERAAADARTEQAFLACLDAREADNRPVSDANGPNFAPAMFERMKEAQGLKKVALRTAMERLFADKKLKIEEFKRSGRIARKIVRR